jgi:uncharacterized protein (DUF736 family)
MTDYDDTNRGALFKNDKKESDRHPDYRGNINVGGTEYWLSAWMKTSVKGTRYMSLSVTEKEAAHSAGVAKAKAAVVGFDEDDDDSSLPF